MESTGMRKRMCSSSRLMSIGWDERRPRACAGSWCALASGLASCSESCWVLMLKSITTEPAIHSYTHLSAPGNHLPSSSLIITPLLGSHYVHAFPSYLHLVLWSPLSKYFAQAYQALWEASYLSILHLCQRGNKKHCVNKHEAFSLFGYDRLSDSLVYGARSTCVSSPWHKHVTGQALSTFLTLGWPFLSPQSWERANVSFTSLKILSRCIVLPDTPLGGFFSTSCTASPRPSPLYDKYGTLRTPRQFSQLTVIWFTIFFLMWEAEY